MSTIIQTINDRRSCAEMLEDQERVKKVLRLAVSVVPSVRDYLALSETASASAKLI